MEPTMIEIVFAGCLLSLSFGCPFWIAALADHPKKSLKIFALIGAQIILLTICNRYLPPKNIEHFFTPAPHTEKLTTA
jgi:hypothetical protein